MCLYKLIGASLLGPIWTPSKHPIWSALAYLGVVVLCSFFFTSLLLATRPAYIKVLVEGGEGGEVYFMPFTPQDSNGIRLYGGILPRPTPRLNKKSMSFSNI